VSSLSCHAICTARSLQLLQQPFFQVAVLHKLTACWSRSRLSIQLHVFKYMQRVCICRLVVCVTCACRSASSYACVLRVPHIA